MFFFVVFSLALIFFKGHAEEQGFLMFDQRVVFLPGFMKFYPECIQSNIKSKTQVDPYVDVWSFFLHNFFFFGTLSSNFCHLYLSFFFNWSLLGWQLLATFLNSDLCLLELVNLLWISLPAVVSRTCLLAESKGAYRAYPSCFFSQGTQIYTNCSMSRNCCCVFCLVLWLFTVWR